MNRINVEEQESTTVNIFCCYTLKDQHLFLELKSHLMSLQREGLITLWADTDIDAGTDWKEEIRQRLRAAHIILFLVSPDFMASDYCYSVEMKDAMERYQQGEAQIIPIILRPVDWQNAPFGRLQALPTKGEPVTSRVWGSQDEAFYTIVVEVREAVFSLLKKKSKKTDGMLKDARFLSQAIRLPSKRRRLPLIITTFLLMVVILLVIYGIVIDSGTLAVKWFGIGKGTPVQNNQTATVQNNQTATAIANAAVIADRFGTAVNDTGTVVILDAAPGGIYCSPACFFPSHIKIKVGTKILWINDSTVPQTVTALHGLSLSVKTPDPDIFDSGIGTPLQSGNSFSYTVAKAAYNANPSHQVLYYSQLDPSIVGMLTIVI